MIFRSVRRIVWMPVFAVISAITTVTMIIKEFGLTLWHDVTDLKYRLTHGHEIHADDSTPFVDKHTTHMHILDRPDEDKDARAKRIVHIVTCLEHVRVVHIHSGFRHLQFSDILMSGPSPFRYFWPDDRRHKRPHRVILCPSEDLCSSIKDSFETLAQHRRSYF